MCAKHTHTRNNYFAPRSQQHDFAHEKDIKCPPKENKSKEGRTISS